MSDEGIVRVLVEALGNDVVIIDSDVTSRYLVDQRELLRGSAAAVLRPSTVAEVVTIMKLSKRFDFGVVPQGGNTSYCGGATPDRSGRHVVVSLERLNKVRAVDATGFTITVDAGVVLKDAQAVAEANGLFLGLGLGSEGSCQIGGNVSTNAGGTSVVRYGMTRDLVLGLEVVLPDGRVLNDLRCLRKNNTGYDIKQLFIGAEGTLGIVTGVVLKLQPLPSTHATAWLALSKSANLADILTFIRRETSDLVSSFEYLSPASLALLTDHATSSGLPKGASGAVLVELASSTTRISLDELLAGVVETLIEKELVSDAVLALSSRQRESMWRCREGIPEGEKRAGGSVKHDISLPLSQIDTFLARAGDLIRSYDRSLILSVYGHIGDGNLHYNLLVPPGADRVAFGHQLEGSLSGQIYDLAAALGGAFSAEHGVGRLKRTLMERYADPVRIEAMRALKCAMDPDNRMNPGAVVDAVVPRFALHRIV